MAPAPLITVVVATLDAARSLPRCLASLRAQTFRDFEVLVMDGGSTDGTQALLAASDAVTAWRSAPDAGLYAAWNAALPLARGEWICFLGADDWLWDADALARLVPHLKAPPPAGGERAVPPRVRIVYSRVRQVDAAGETVEELGEPWETFRAKFRSRDCLPHPGLMHHRSLFAEHGAFDASLTLAADYEFLLRELKGRDAHYVPALTVGASWGGRTTRLDLARERLRQTGEALRRHGLRPPAWTWAWWSLLVRVHGVLAGALGERAAARLADLYRVLTLRKPRYARRDGQGTP